jgi:tetratricopeptide (TPR) repeat protein
VHLRTGQAHEAAGRNAEALEHYRKAIAIDPDEPTLRVSAARVLNSLNQPGEAVASLNLVPDGALNESTGHEYERAGLTAIMTRGDKAIETAIDAFSKAEARLPKSARCASTKPSRWRWPGVQKRRARQPSQRWRWTRHTRARGTFSIRSGRPKPYAVSPKP